MAKGPREKKIGSLIDPIEEAMGGKVVLDHNGRFYLKVPAAGFMEMHLVAEGIRKLATLVRLISTGSLIEKGYLFWDEPEANLNPELVKLLAEMIYQISSHGIQVFVATHSLFMLRELEILSQKKDFKSVQHRYFALRPEQDGVAVEQGEAIDDLQTIVSLDEELLQSDRFMDLD